MSCLKLHLAWSRSNAFWSRPRSRELALPAAAFNNKQTVLRSRGGLEAYRICAMKREGGGADEYAPEKRQRKDPAAAVKCPYLDTVNRQLLDFDQLKMCSSTLTNMNVYSCLVCGKFFRGRGAGTPAYTHSVQAGHFVFMSLHDGRAFCLPDSYEIDDISLDDVKKNFSPVFSKAEIAALNKNTSLARDVHGGSYLPGFVGLNCLNHSDFITVVLQALSHVVPLRDFFLDPKNYSSEEFVDSETGTKALDFTPKSLICHSFGNMVRKLWSRDNFKSVISPIEFVQDVVSLSKKRFDVGRQSEAIDFLVWLLDELHKGLKSTPGVKSVVQDCFMGQVEVVIKCKRSDLPVTEEEREKQMAIDEGSGGGEEDGDGEEWVVTDKKALPFNFLSLDIPPTPLFRDASGGTVIPQVSLFEVLRKFDGNQWVDHIDPRTGRFTRRQYRLLSLPKYLVLHLVRFTKTNFNQQKEKNNTCVTFPVKNLEMKEYLRDPRHELLRRVADDAPSCSVSELKDAIKTFASTAGKASLATINDRSELEKTALEAVRGHSDVATKYDLLANICHDSEAKDVIVKGSAGRGSAGRGSASTSNDASQGSYKVHLKNKAVVGQWFQIQDLQVRETLSQIIGLSESYLLIYERKDQTPL